MATSPLFGWQEPDDTSLVKDGAAAIRTLGNAIDSSMADLLGGTTGQVLSKASNTDMDFTWVAQDDSNAIQNAIVDAKGDLIAASAADTPARLAVGTNGQVLTADSTAATGLAWATASSAATSLSYSAGKNKIINGNFGIWQRGTSFTPAINTYVYCADRFRVIRDGSGTVTVSQQTFTPGTAPVSGYEGQYFLRYNQSVAGSGGTYSTFEQPIEDVRTYAGQTVTISFWAKADASRSFTPQFIQGFGSGGSSRVDTNGSSITVTTSWARYTQTIAIPSVSGKTIGTNSNIIFVLNLALNAAQTLDFWGFQIEVGSTATAFQTASGSIAGELALAQRYFANVVPSTADYGTVISMFQAISGSAAKGGIRFPVPMRVSASITLANANNFTLTNSAYTPIGGSSFTYAVGNTVDCRIDMSVASGLVAGNATALSGNTANLLIQASAEF